MDLKNFNLETLKRYTSSQSINDFDKFLDALPSNVGMNAMTALVVMWIIAGSFLYFVSGQSDKAATIRSSLTEVESLTPPVPSLEYNPVEKTKLDEFSKTVKEIYKGLNITAKNGGEVMISAQDTDFFPQFLAAVGYFQRGAKNWKVNISEMCVGRDCKSAKLTAKLKIETVKIKEPQTEDIKN